MANFDCQFDGVNKPKGHLEYVQGITVWGSPTLIVYGINS